MRKSQQFNSFKILSTLPIKLTKQSSISRILQFSVIIQVQERLPGRSNPLHEESALMLLISGFNKKFPRIKVHYVTTEDHAADIFTKSLAAILYAIVLT
jgi:hypothetical protein